MDNLFTFLHEIEDRYARTIFNFHLTCCKEIGDIYGLIKDRISSENLFDKVVINKDIKPMIKKLVYCDIQLTKHIINPDTYPDINDSSQIKCCNFFDINTDNSNISNKTVEIFEREKSSLISYIKTTNKKRKVNYGEIKKTVHGGGNNNYFSGKRSDDYLSTTVRSNVNQPWIKTISKRMRIDIINHSIVTRGKSSILQTIEIVCSNRTCIKIFKDSTMHIILSKDKTENGCLNMINKLFDVYLTLFLLLEDIVGNGFFKRTSELIRNVLLVNTLDEKISLIKKMYDDNIYGVHNFKIGMFNLTFIKPIEHTVFPSLLEENSKIKFFKGKKLNIVALRSLEDCVNYVTKSETIMEIMKERSAILNSIDIETASVDYLKELLLK
ncbi:intermediate transcription factor [Murmansk poxvirus]|uniref:Intermediate transcription factor 3 large subunit n=1 Tax=Murmansk poxvirus TaxID=2025359 RepID=A0A223FMX3_9POXV|nr:intermediate transcription factor [Murmansk poxvirus]AST09334.1 intermediate transcription factor [Murmansk poxvirus]